MASSSMLTLVKSGSLINSLVLVVVAGVLVVVVGLAVLAVVILLEVLFAEGDVSLAVGAETEGDGDGRPVDDEDGSGEVCGG